MKAKPICPSKPGFRTTAIRLFAAACALTFGLLDEAAASRLKLDFPQSPTSTLLDANGKKAKILQKIDAHLLRTQLEYKAYLARGGMPILGRFRSFNRLLKLRDDRFVGVQATASAGSAPALAAMLKLGCRRPSVYKRVIAAECPIATVDRLSKEPSIKFTRAAMSLTRSGSALSQGDQALYADLARSTSGTGGAGITVGTLSDSYDCSSTALTNAAADMASGDLPVGVTVLADVTPGSSDCTDEGRAMMQVIHDIAPGADLVFHTTTGGQTNFASGILALKAAGARVIVDDAFTLDEPMFQDGGPIKDAINQVTSQGVVYFSAAGNASRDSYESTFSPSGQFEEEFGGELHDFDPGAGIDVYQALTLPASVAGTPTPIAFQWDEPFFSISGEPGASSDYDIWICLSDTAPVGLLNCPIQGVAGNVGENSIETLLPIVSDGTEPLTVYIAISRTEGTANNLLKYVAFNDAMSIDEHATSSSTLYGHGNSQGALTVGAARYNQTPAFLQDPALLEPFSSAGGTAFHLNSAGGRLQPPLTPARPNVVAPDGGNNTFFGGDFDSDGFPNFTGTSAAAAHAAGVAALMLEASTGRGLAMPGAVYTALETTAIDMGTAGFDYDSGFGLIKADAAVTAVSTPKLAIASIDAIKAEGNAGTTAFTFAVTRTGDLSQPSGANYSVAGSGSNPADTADFSGATSGSVSFAANEASQTITVNVVGDAAVEPDEGFTVTLSNPTNATISTGTADGTIQNDDAALDTDADGVADSQDNCSLVANTNQRNTDGDAYGNICDPDFNGNNIVDPADFSQIKSLIGSTTSPSQDLNGNGIVDPSDISLTKSYVGKAPGPSGLVTP